MFSVSLLASEIQMMALPHAQYVLADAGTPVTATANSDQVKTVRHWHDQKLILPCHHNFAYAFIIIS